MIDREKVIKGLQEAVDWLSTETSMTVVDQWVVRDALALLKGSFTPQQVYDTVIEHAQHDTRFKLGDKIDYSFTDVVDILNMELMCKAGDM